MLITLASDTAATTAAAANADGVVMNELLSEVSSDRCDISGVLNTKDWVMISCAGSYGYILPNRSHWFHHVYIAN